MSHLVNGLPCYMNSERYPQVPAEDFHRQQAAMASQNRPTSSGITGLPAKRERSASTAREEAPAKRHRVAAVEIKAEVIEIASDDESEQSSSSDSSDSSSLAVEQWAPPALDDTTLKQYMTAPAPAKHYPTHIYTGSTHNPLFVAAIIALAERNLPSVNFVSARNHIPNVPYWAPDPVLTKTNAHWFSYLDYKPQPHDLELFVTFAPGYYADGRHCLGYMVLMPYNLIRGEYQHDEGLRSPSSMLYTPCTDEDLEFYGLVRARGALDPMMRQELPVLGGQWVNGFFSGRNARNNLRVWEQRFQWMRRLV